MSSRPLHIVSSARPAMQRAQMSHPKAFGPVGGRGRVLPLRPMPERSAGDVTRKEFLAWWSGLMLRRCGSARAVAQLFGTTEQTGRNWIDGFACPTGLQVIRAQEWWPGDFTGAGATMRRAVR